MWLLPAVPGAVVTHVFWTSGFREDARVSCVRRPRSNSNNMGCGASKADAGADGSPSGAGSAAKAPAKQTSGVKKVVPGPSLPESLPSATEELDVSESTDLKDLVNVSKYTKLIKLDANSCALTALPSEIEACTALEELLVYANKIKDVPKELAKCEALTTLNFFNNQIGGEGLEHVMQFLKERERDKSKILPKLNRVRVGKNKLSSEQQQALEELCSELGLKCET